MNRLAPFLPLLALLACDPAPSTAHLDGGAPDLGAPELGPGPDQLTPHPDRGPAPDAPLPTAYEMVQALTSPFMTGRKAGTLGGSRAADYIAQRLAACGVLPLGDTLGSYYNTFKVTPIENSGKMELTVQPAAGAAHSFTYRKEWRCGRNSPSGDLTAPMIFVGYGLTDAKHDDYAGVAIKGKIALVLKGCPPIAGITGCNDLDKIQNAGQQQAAGLLMIVDGSQVALWGGGQGTDLYAIPAALIDENVTDKLLPAGKDLATLRKGLVSSGPASFDTGAKLKLVITRTVTPDADAHNVLGVIPAAKPEGPATYVVAGAHYDHLGYDEPPHSYFAGALDNASGTAVVIDAACRLAQSPPQDSVRSVVVGLWAGEEDGLLGSRHWLDAGPVRATSIQAAFNLDMVGGTGGGPILIRFTKAHRRELEPALLPLVATAGLTGSYGNIQTTSSDHASFVARDVPTVYLIGPHPPLMQYHTTTDTIAQLSADTLDDLGWLLARSLSKLASN